jgi:putative membrane protein
VELLGSSTGLIFGEYGYTPLLQPQLAGVPLLVPLAWLMMFPPAWAVAALIDARLPTLRTSLWRELRFALLAALAFTAWDLFLDPQMVAWGFWNWDQPGGYFGIPWTNYAGWLLVSTSITLLIRPKDLPLLALVLVYCVTWILETIGQLFFWGLPGPAAFGFLGMGAMLIWAFYRWKG